MHKLKLRGTHHKRRKFNGGEDQGEGKVILREKKKAGQPEARGKKKNCGGLEGGDWEKVGTEPKRDQCELSRRIKLRRWRPSKTVEIGRRAGAIHVREKVKTGDGTERELGDQGISTYRRRGQGGWVGNLTKVLRNQKEGGVTERRICQVHQ